MKFLIEIEILDNDIETNEDTETSITKEDLEQHLRIGFDNSDLDDEYALQFIGYDLERESKVPTIKGYSIKTI